MLIKTFKDSIFDIIKLSSGLDDQQIIWSEQNAPIPSYTFIELKILDILDKSFEQIPKNNGKIEIVTQKVANLSINIYGQGSDDIIQQILNYLNYPSILIELQKKDISLGYPSEARNLSLLEEGYFTQRWQFNIDCYFNTSSSDLDSTGDDDVGYYDKIEVTGTAKNTVNDFTYIDLIDPP